MDSPSNRRVSRLSDETTSSEIESSGFANIERVLAGLAHLQVSPSKASLPGEAIKEHKVPAGRSEELQPTIEDRYRVLVEQIPAVVFMAYLDGGISEAYVSPHIEQMLGFSRDEWLDDPIRWYHQIHPEDRDRWSAEAAEMFLKGSALKSIYRVIARDGRVVWFQCEAKLVRREDGQPWFIHGVGFDITELKETEHALQEEIAERQRLQKLELERQIARTEQSESRLAAIVESSEDAIIGKSLDGVITSWNAAASRLFGYESAEIIGNSILLLVPEELHQQEREVFRKLRAGERIERLESHRVTKEGGRVEVSLTISPIRNGEGRIVGASTIARDITERRRIEDQLRTTEKIAAAGRLAATISHEINNPLEAVVNLIFLTMTDSALPEQARRNLENADRELLRVSHIVRQTLGFYRDTSSPVTVNVADLLTEILELYRRKIDYKILQVRTQFDRTCELHILQGEIRQVFANIVANAVDASPEQGALILRVAVVQWKSPGTSAVRVTIADQGSGMAGEVRSRIFQPFFSTKQNVGTGLGLWVSKSLVEKHGGSIRFRSRVTPGKSGTVFSILLPCKRTEISVSSAA
jgi:PAS domain S-box-containing protein